MGDPVCVLLAVSTDEGVDEFLVDYFLETCGCLVVEHVDDVLHPTVVVWLVRHVHLGVARDHEQRRLHFVEHPQEDVRELRLVLCDAGVCFLNEVADVHAQLPHLLERLLFVALRLALLLEGKEREPRLVGLHLRGDDPADHQVLRVHQLVERAGKVEYHAPRPLRGSVVQVEEELSEAGHGAALLLGEGEDIPCRHLVDPAGEAVLHAGHGINFVDWCLPEGFNRVDSASNVQQALRNSLL
mmetsp:Transcript_16191/g.63127  ORF Transcript_16191/g.63127 Transcript_16191/m.63127 type:complete len:242 (+) Transcript_16191:1779-2504(+)